VLALRVRREVGGHAELLPPLVGRDARELGLVSHSVGRRTLEIGIRLAVGARRRDVLRLFVIEMATLVVLGIALGAPLALGVARQFGAILYDLAPPIR
jgi:ABC-type antimicrobial peptide transport system permease subunit